MVVGDPSHPEVKAVVDTVDGDAVVVNPAKPGEWRTKRFKPKMGLVCQTTLPQEQLAAVVAELLLVAKELKIYNTICHATRERQTETAQLAQEVDVLLVIGGKNSANTRKLVEIGASFTPTYHIESGEEIKPQWLEGEKNNWSDSRSVDPSKSDFRGRGLAATKLYRRYNYGRKSSYERTSDGGGR